MIGIRAARRGRKKWRHQDEGAHLSLDFSERLREALTLLSSLLDDHCKPTGGSASAEMDQAFAKRLGELIRQFKGDRDAARRNETAAINAPATVAIVESCLRWLRDAKPKEPRDQAWQRVPSASVRERYA